MPSVTIESQSCKTPYELLKIIITILSIIEIVTISSCTDTYLCILKQCYTIVRMNYLMQPFYLGELFHIIQRNNLDFKKSKIHF